MRGVTGDQSITDASPIAEAKSAASFACALPKRPAVSGRVRVKAAIRVPARSKVRDLSDYVSQMVMPLGVAGSSRPVFAGGRTC